MAGIDSAGLCTDEDGGLGERPDPEKDNWGTLM